MPNLLSCSITFYSEPKNIYKQKHITFLFQTPSFYAIQKCFKFMDGKISMSLKTFKGFAPAQIIPFEVGILNEQKIKISKIKVFLIQVGSLIVENTLLFKFFIHLNLIKILIIIVYSSVYIY